MKNKNIVSELIRIFFVTTTLITIASGVVGILYFKEATIGYESFLSPPLFGFLSSLISIVNYSKKEMSISQAVIRKVIHLLLIEEMILGLNYNANGNNLAPQFYLILAVVTMLIFVSVGVIIYMNDKKMSENFNRELILFQSKMAE